jgi:polysaccharide export outer membrane protein
MAIAERCGDSCLIRWWSSAYRVLIIILAGSALFCGPLHAESIEPASYRLAPGDKIEIMVLGQKELSGAFTVDSTGSIQLLIVGNLPVKGLTIEDVKKRIVDRLSDGYIKEPLVSVRVSEPRPVFILGNVRRAGSYKFRYGSTVKSLLAEAGGVGSPETEHVAVADFLAADERMQGLKQTHKALIIRLARLEAQRNGKENFIAPSSPVLAGEGDVADIVSREEEVFQTQNQALRSQVEMLRNQKSRLQQQITALKGELTTHLKQIDLAKQQVERYEDLAPQGLVRSSTLVEYKQNEARYETDRWRIIGEVSHLEFNSAEIDAKIQEAEAGFKRQVATDLEGVRQRLKELEISLPIATEIRNSRWFQVSGAVQDSSYSIHVTRMTDDKSEVFEGTETTTLQPGDIIEIKLQLAAEQLH